MSIRKKVYIYGAGNYGKKLFCLLQGMGVSIRGFVQTIVEEKFCCGLPVFSLFELVENKDKIIVLIAMKSKETSREIKTNLTNLRVEEIEIYECGNFIQENLEENSTAKDKYCNLCNHYVDGFLPNGEDAKIFEICHIIGGGKRENVICPICAASDRDRWKMWVLSKHTDIFTSRCSVLHVAPEVVLQERIQMNKECDYYSGDIVPKRAMHVIDLTDIQFKDNTFDYVIVNHVLEHIENEALAITELLRILKPNGILMLSFPICTDCKTYEDFSIKSPQKRLELYGQEDHVRLYGNDYKERLEEYQMNIAVYTPANECLPEEIEKYGFISDDVSMLCSKKNVKNSADYKVRLSEYDFQLCTHCNLKCKGCGTFSNYEKEEFADLEEYIKDITRLAEIYSGGVEKVCLYGGEPFLHPQVSEFAEATRKIFKDSYCYILTNGLLLPHISERILKKIKECDIVIKITKYIPTAAIEDKIRERLERLGIRYEFQGDTVTKFFKNKNIKGTEDKEKAFAKCYGCHVLKHGILAQCGLPILAKENFKKYFNFEFMEFEADKDYIDIYNTKLTGNEINKLFAHSKEFCKFCRIHEPELYDWTVTSKKKPDIYDWSVY